MSRNIEINIKQQNGDVTNYETLYPKTVSKNILYNGDDEVTVWDKLNNLTPSTTFEVGDILLTSKTINLGTNQWLICDGSSVNTDLYPELKNQGNNFTITAGTENESVVANKLYIISSCCGLYCARPRDNTTYTSSLFFCKKEDDISIFENWKAVDIISFYSTNTTFCDFYGISGGTKIEDKYFFLVCCPWNDGAIGYYYVVLNENLERLFLSKRIVPSRNGGYIKWMGITKESDVSYNVIYGDENANTAMKFAATAYNINLTNKTWEVVTVDSSRDNYINWVEKIDGVYYFAYWGAIYKSTSLNLTPYGVKGTTWKLVGEKTTGKGNIFNKANGWYISQLGYCSKDFINFYSTCKKYLNSFESSYSLTEYFWMENNDDEIIFTPMTRGYNTWFSYYIYGIEIYDFSSIPVLKKKLKQSSTSSDNVLFPFIKGTENLGITSNVEATSNKKYYNLILSYQLPTIPTDAQITGATYYIKVGNDN